MPRQVLLFLIIVSPDSFNDFMEQLNINLPIIGDLHTFLHTNESCSDEEKKQITSLVSFVLRKCLALTILKSTFFFPPSLLFFPEALHLREKKCHQLPPHLIQPLLSFFFFSSHLIEFVQCMACCNDLISVVSLSILFLVYWDTGIYSFCIAMLCFTFLLSLLSSLNLSTILHLALCLCCLLCFVWLEMEDPFSILMSLLSLSLLLFEWIQLIIRAMHASFRPLLLINSLFWFLSWDIHKCLSFIYMSIQSLSIIPFDIMIWVLADQTRKAKNGRNILWIKYVYVLCTSLCTWILYINYMSTSSSMI